MHRLLFRRKRWIILIFSFLALALANWLELCLQRKSNVIGGGLNRPFLFLLINLHVILIAVLLYIIIKQSIKLVIERRRKTLGSGFKQNLFFAFMLFSVIPSFFVFFTAGKFITSSIDKWFQVQIGQGLQSGFQLYQALTIREHQLIAQNPDALDGCERYTWQIKDKTSWKKMMIREVRVWRSYRITNDRSTKSLRDLFIKKIRQVGMYQQQVFDFYGSLYAITKTEHAYHMVVYRYPEAVRTPLIALHNAINDVAQLTSMQTSINQSYFFTFLLVVLLILLLSIWCAFYLAKGISTPIQDLLQATKKMSEGDWSVAVNTDDQHDLKPLALGFNRMITAVKGAHETLEHRNKEMQMILENINDSVFYVNRFGRIINSNQAAKKLMASFMQTSQVYYRKISFLPRHIRTLFFHLIREFLVSHKEHLVREVTLEINREYKIVMVHLSRMHMAPGILIVIQDLTEIVKLSKAKAWQEAAKQVAHEIKNPLTPIQLATQRLQRKYHTFFEQEPTFADCTQTILAHVKIIKDLASHFSAFASLPAPVMSQVELYGLIFESVRLYELSYPDITYTVISNEHLLKVETDPEKIKQVLVNLLDNSVRAMQSELNKSINKEICISIKEDAGLQVVRITVQDNGPGIDALVREKLFMPYVSTHKKNMGLGLAIVHDIMKQLGGNIRLLPSSYGALFELTLPYK